jgi:hypothetical protein
VRNISLIEVFIIMNKNNIKPVKEVKKAPAKEELKHEYNEMDFKSFLQGMAKNMTENLKSKFLINFSSF